MIRFIVGCMIGGTVGIFTMCFCKAASDADKCMDSTDSEE